MRRSTVPVLTTLIACGALALPASAAGGPQLTDPTGDANGVNSQSIGLPVPSQTTPAGVAAADIVSTSFTTTYKKVGKKQVPNGLRIVLTLAAAPQENTVYGVTATVPDGCDGKAGTDLSASYQLIAGVVSAFVTCGPHGSAETTDIAMGDAVVDAAKKTITWDVSGDTLEPGSVFEEIAADTSVFVVGVFDEAKGDATYTYK